MTFPPTWTLGFRGRYWAPTAAAGWTKTLSHWQRHLQILPLLRLQAARQQHARWRWPVQIWTYWTILIYIF